MIEPGDYVHKRNRHKFQGYVISVGVDRDDQTICTVQHWPEGWIFHFREEQLVLAKEGTMDDRND
jgi:hypothetical protein